MNNPEHRLAAIIFSDISGYTALMGENESEAMKILKKNQEIHTRYFTKFKCLYYKQMGDGFMAVFSSLSNAVYASAHIIEETKTNNIKVRIGVHEGDIIFQDNDVYGDGVNIASRLEQVSKPGSIYISDSVRRNLENKEGISAEYVREATLKNVKEPVKIYEVKILKEYLPPKSPEKRKFSLNAGSSWWRYITILIISLGLIYFFRDTIMTRFTDQIKSNSRDIHLPGNSIAVLPFIYNGHDSAYTYLGSGFADGILTKLSLLNDFTIISRSSSFKFKNSDLNIDEIAGQLGVKMILEGSYQVSNNDIRINTKLIAVDGNRILMAETYNGKLESIFQLQDLVSEGLFRLLGKSEIIREESLHQANEPKSLTAFRYYQVGISLLKENYLYRSTIYESRKLFKMALTEDAEYIDPFIGMAESFLYEIFFGYNSIYYVKDSIEKYLSAAKQINPNVGELLTIEGAICVYEFKQEEGLRLIKRGMEINPNYALGYYFSSLVALVNDEKFNHLEYINKAITLDPFNGMFRISKVIQCIFLSEMDTAKVILNNWLNLQPGDNMALYLKGIMLTQEYQYKEALEVLLQRSIGDSTNNMVAFLQGKLGNTSRAEHIIKILIDRSRNTFVSPTMIAIAYMGINDKKNTMKWIEEAYNQKDEWALWLLSNIFEPLHDDPGFVDIMKKLNLYSTLRRIYG